VPERLAAIISLGCAKNQVDSQVMASQLLDMGYGLTTDRSRASLILINTCGFLQSSVEESIDAILELAQWKDVGTCRHLVVAGCMVQRYGRKLAESLPEVDLFVGTSHCHRLGELLSALETTSGSLCVYLSRPRELLEHFGSSRVADDNPASVYLRVADGCSNRCTFCMIPRLRGPLRSRPLKAVLKEARLLAHAGAVEINLIAQDITAFGSEDGDRGGLIALLEGLERIEGIRWVRLLYAYPDGVSDRLLQFMRESTKVLPYLDVPLQHCAPHILRAMRGKPSFIEADEFVGRLRSAIPHIALRTTLMVGFPGETEGDFEALLAFVQRARFDHLGVFAFSPEPGTRAARLPDQVSNPEKESRRHKLLLAQSGISREILSRMVGRLLPVFIEGPHPETDLLIKGRLESQAPEVDGSVLITSGTAETGQIVLARVTRSHTYDVEAEIHSDEAAAI
jgi:ribosomal protein S12 methylthiotransferase